MLSRVTISAEQLKVVEVHRDLRTLNVVWCDVDLVVDNDARIVTPLLQALLA